MSVVGSLIFCLDCGDLLENPSTVEGTEIECSQCQAKYPKSKFSNLKVVTSTSADAFPSSLKLKQSVVKTSLGRDELKDGATIKEKCPKCGNDEMHYHTLQLRSADEGATVFYTCTNCGYKFRTNN
ncbi:DNA-directed RNA polymerase I subunit RPA12 [Zygosaccharomyces bailii ISA1307]|nr:DNA-directed RNA polymerase I subunit RPA12 [Zygosaccharomyces bailii ISA1307]